MDSDQPAFCHTGEASGVLNVRANLPIHQPSSVHCAQLAPAHNDEVSLIGCLGLLDVCFVGFVSRLRDASGLPEREIPAHCPLQPLEGATSSHNRITSPILLPTPQAISLPMSTTLVARDDDGEVQVQQFKQQCLDYLDTILEHIGGFGEGVNILNDEHLATLNVRKAQPLDIDEGSVDFGPRFFAPRFTLAEAQQKTDAFLADHGEDMGNDGWPKRCRRGSYTSFLDDPDITYDPEDFHPLCDPHTQAAFRLAWFLNAIGADWYSEYSDSSNNGVWEDSDWDYVE